MGKKVTIAGVVGALALFLADTQTADLLVSIGISAAVAAKLVGIGKLATSVLAAVGNALFAAPATPEA